MTRTGRRFRELTAEEAIRALYIDFEGEKDRAPVLLGAHRRGRGARPYVHIYLLDRTFEVFGTPANSLRDGIDRVVRRAEHGHRRIVSWSQHELGVVRTLRDEDPNLVDRFEARFVNALSLAKDWRRMCYGGDRPADGRLIDYLALIDYEVPDEAAGGDVGDTIRTIRRTVEGGRTPTDLQRERWRRLVEHNAHDCIGMRRLIIWATREIDSESVMDT